MFLLLSSLLISLSLQCSLLWDCGVVGQLPVSAGAFE